MSIRHWLSLIAGSIALVIFCLYIASFMYANADAIFPFSFSLDIIQRLPLHDWMFPIPTFIFPDIVISIPIVYFFRDPLTWFNIVSVLQPFFLIFLTSLFIKSEHPKLTLFAPITYIFILLYAIGHLLMGNLLLFFPSLFLMAYHMSAAILALFFYLWTTPQKLQRLNVVFYFIFFLASYSDLFFFLYFFALIVATVLIYRLQIIKYVDWIKTISMMFVCGFLGILLNNFTNHKILRQFGHTDHATAVYPLNSVLLFLGLPILFFVLYGCFAKNHEKRKIVLPLVLGYFLILSGLIFAGMLDITTLRYIIIFFPMVVFITAYLMPKQVFYYLTALPVSTLIIIFALLNGNHQFGMHYPPTSNIMLNCADFKKYSQNATVVANYWQAKILFEASHRAFHLIQTNDKLELAPWMDNAYWRTGKLPSIRVPNDHIIVVMDGLENNTQRKIRRLSSAKSLCNGNVIYLPKKVEMFAWQS